MQDESNVPAAGGGSSAAPATAPDAATRPPMKLSAAELAQVIGSPRNPTRRSVVLGGIEFYVRELTDADTADWLELSEQRAKLSAEKWARRIVILCLCDHEGHPVFPGPRSWDKVAAFRVPPPWVDVLLTEALRVNGLTAESQQATLGN